MKIQKIKITPIRRAKKRPSATVSNIVLVHTKRPGLRYFRLVNHKHTGKLIHVKHTSHVALVGILIVVGFFMYISNGVTYAVTSEVSVTVGVVVNGPPPEVGATITSPVDGDKFVDKERLVVTGTCQPSTFVVIQDNGQLAGSTVCTEAGIYNLTIQIQLGKNILSALNYDNINQAGPDTPSVTITVHKSKPGKPVVPTTLINSIDQPILPVNPSIIPGVASVISSCEDYRAGSLSSGGDVRIAVVCIPRLFGSNIQQVLGILVWGGTPPYAISINWGNGIENTLLSITEPGYYKSNFSYAFPGIYRVDFLIKDKSGESAVVQSSVQVNGKVATPAGNTSNTDGIEWLKTPVPLYVIAVAITLGFWGGDIFTRAFSLGSYKNHGARKARRV